MGAATDLTKKHDFISKFEFRLRQWNFFFGMRSELDKSDSKLTWIWLFSDTLTLTPGLVDTLLVIMEVQHLQKYSNSPVTHHLFHPRGVLASISFSSLLWWRPNELWRGCLRKTDEWRLYQWMFVCQTEKGERSREMNSFKTPLMKPSECLIICL